MFDLIWNEEATTAIMEMTNDTLTQNGQLPVTAPAIRRYIGTYLLMCVEPLPKLVDHWSPQNKHDGQLPKHQWMYIHANREIPTQHLFELIGRRSRLFVDVGTEVCVDELQTDFTGYSPVHVFNPSKPHAWEHLIHSNRAFQIAIVLGDWAHSMNEHFIYIHILHLNHFGCHLRSVVRLCQ